MDFAIILEYAWVLVVLIVLEGCLLPTMRSYSP